MGLMNPAQPRIARMTPAKIQGKAFGGFTIEKIFVATNVDAPKIGSASKSNIVPPKG